MSLPFASAAIEAVEGCYVSKDLAEMCDREEILIAAIRLTHED